MRKIPLRQRMIAMIPEFVLLSLIISVVFVAFRIAFAPSESHGEDHVKLKSDYVLMLLQCLIGIFAMALPSILNHALKLVFPHKMILLYVIFLYCAIFLGEVRSFYYLVPNWDTILHIFSGAMLGALGFSLISVLNNSVTVKLKMSPHFVALFAFCFAVSLGVVWEIYEFAADGLLGVNMQKFAMEDGALLIGRAALADTMKDLIVDVAGALLISIIGYISIRREPDWLSKFEIQSEDLNPKEVAVAKKEPEVPALK